MIDGSFLVGFQVQGLVSILYKKIPIYHSIIIWNTSGNKDEILIKNTLNYDDFYDHQTKNFQINHNSNGIYIRF